MSETLNREQLLTRLCALGKVVQDHLGYRYAADCFCGNNPLGTDPRNDFRWDAEVVDFIDDAVREKVAALCGSPREIKQT